jgi:hypothetical protein
MALNQFQRLQNVHPFTCGENFNHEPLVAGPHGWLCIDCGYRQGWAHASMADPKTVRAFRKQESEMRKLLKAKA